MVVISVDENLDVSGVSSAPQPDEDAADELRGLSGLPWMTPGALLASRLDENEAVVFVAERFGETGDIGVLILVANEDEDTLDAVFDAERSTWIDLDIPFDLRVTFMGSIPQAIPGGYFVHSDSR